MTMDRTLKQSGGLIKTRSVMSRAERIEAMVEEGNFDPEKGNPLGLPKLKVKRSKAGGKSKKAAEQPADAEAAAGTEGEDAAATSE